MQQYIYILLIPIYTFILSISPNIYLEAEEKHLNNDVSVFLGATSNLDHDETAFTLGVDYEYLLPFAERIFGIGVFGEVAFFDEEEYLIGFPLSLHLPHHFRLIAAPGIAIIDEDHGTEEEFLFRLAAGYAYELGNGFNVKTGIAVDFIDDEVSLVYGAALGYEF